MITTVQYPCQQWYKEIKFKKYSIHAQIQLHELSIGITSGQCCSTVPRLLQLASCREQHAVDERCYGEDSSDNSASPVVKMRGISMDQQ